MKKQLTEEEFIDKWLGDYHNTTLKEVQDTHPEWMKEPEKHTRDFYMEYAVTQEQYDEWYEWAIGKLMKHHGCGRKMTERFFAMPSLNVAPSVKQEK